jgi:hypothetical protein
LGQTKDKGTIAGLKVVLISIAIFLYLAFVLKLLYWLPIRDSLLCFVGFFLYFYIPGNLLLRCLNFNKDEYFVSLFHSIALGAALMPLVYIIFRRLSHPEVVYPFGVAIFLVWLILTLRDFKNGRINVYTTYKDILSVTVLIFAVFGLLHLSHFTDIIFFENGFKIRNIYLNETIFHLGIINSLRGIFHPIYPYASGVDFSHYHLNMHYEIEMFNRLFSIDTIKLTFFYFPLLYFSLLVFVPYIFVRKYWGMRFFGILTGILMFGSDLSFIPGLLGMFPQGYAWTIFSTTTIWSLFTLNGNLPALFVMFLSILYLKNYYEAGRLLYLVIFAVLGFSAYGFKSSMGPHIMAASFLTGIASMIFTKDKKKGGLLCAISALTILAIAIDMILFKGNAGNNVLSIDLFNRFKDSLTKLGVFNLPWFFYITLFPIYILITFGIRVLGIFLLKDIFKKNYFDAVVVFLLIFVVSGFLLSEVIFFGSPSYKINNACWFAVQSLMASWLLLFYFMVKLTHDRKKVYGIIILVILFSAPTTVQFLTLRFAPDYYTVDSYKIQVMRYLETTSPGSVVLHPPNYYEPSLASNLTGRPSVLGVLQSYVTENIGQAEADERLKDVRLFFSSRGAINRYSVLKKYKVDYVYAPISYTACLNKEPMLIQVLKNSEVDYVYAPMSHAACLDKEPMLMQVLKNSEYVVYKVGSNNSL